MGYTVLIVDDEESLLSLLTQAFESIGFDVLVAPDGDHALRLFRDNSAKIDLMLTDLSMPGLRGDALAREIRILTPVLPIVLMSGNLYIPVLPEGTVTIHKPFALTDLITLVQRLLRQQNPVG